VKVLVDTTIWSLALRRKRRKPLEQALVDELDELINELRAVLIGPIRQEVLSGIPSAKDFEIVRGHLAAFGDLQIETPDYVEAARLYNLCRSKGVQGSHVDFLICAVKMRHSAAVLTTDEDFTNYAKHIDLEIHKPRRG
jgi:predicted nucleic acid-binding protein